MLHFAIKNKINQVKVEANDEAFVEENISEKSHLLYNLFVSYILFVSIF